jgi:microcystin-dependent protein
MDYFIGAIIPWAGGYEPRGWYYCDGRQLNIQQWSALYSVLGTRYGGDAQNYFNLPNLNGRVAVGSATVPANTGGYETVTLTANQVPSHGHTIQANINVNVAGSGIPDADKFPGASGAGLGATQLYKQYSSPNDLVSLNGETLDIYGTPGPHTNLQPCLVTRYIICVDGEYPARP